MSLLLDALKEAENRHRRAPAAAAAAPAAGETPDHVLALADDMAPLTQPAPVARVAADTTAPVQTLAALRAARRAEAPAAAATTRTEPAAAQGAPAGKRPPVLTLLIVGLAALVLVLGGAYGYLTSTTSIAPSRPPQSPTPTPASSTAIPSDAAIREGLVLADDNSDLAPVAPSSVLPPTTGIPPARLERKPVAASPTSTPAPAMRDAASRRDARSVPPPAIAAPPPSAAGRLVIENRPSPLLQAHVALRAGDLVQAERLYRETLATQPDQPDAHLGLALIEQSRGATAAAVAHYRAVLTVIPAQPQAWAGLSDLAGDAELDTMESQLRGLIAARPEASLHFALGNLFARQSRWADAQQSFFAASTAAPQNADYAFNLAVALDRMGKGKVALGHYARALSLAADARAVQFDTAAARTRLAELQGSAP
jgi:Flp pilus assembly protein TadD